MQRYYVVQTKPQRELTAIFELRNQGFETFFPTIRRAPRVIKGRLVTPPLLPMFPKYVFISLNLERDRWRGVNSTRGVVRLICFDDERPSPVPAAHMSWLLEQGAIIDEKAAGLAFSAGDTVEVLEGPLKGHTALVQDAAERRVRVLLSLLGGKVPALVEASNLRAIV